MTHFLLETGIVGAVALAVLYRGTQTYIAYRRSPAYLQKQEARLTKAADRAQRHHIRVLDGLSFAMGRHNSHLGAAERLKAKLS